MLKRLFPSPLRWLTTLSLVVFAATAVAQQSDPVVLERMKKDIFFLASPECEGRGVDTKGINIAADYIVEQIKAAGLKPGGKKGTYFQPFTMAAKGAKQGTSTMMLKGPAGQSVELKFDQDFKVLPSLGSGKIEAPIVFVGYGVTVPADAKAKTDEAAKKTDDAAKKADDTTKKGDAGAGKKKGGAGAPPPAAAVGEVTWVGYDDFKGVDVKGKIVVVLRRVPRWSNDTAQFGGDKEQYAGLASKIAACEKNGAACVIVVNDNSEAAGGDKFMAEGAPKAGIPVAQLKRSVLDQILTSGKGTSLENLEKDIDRDLKPRSGPITGWEGSLSTTTKTAGIPVKNVVGVLEGAGPLANETVVVGAHYDHLGYGKGKNAGKAENRYPGADDNGSGSTTIMELARRFGAIKNRQGRRLVFVWFTGEESGLLGSKHYCEDPMFPLENTIAMFNLDMVGRIKEGDNPELYAEGFNTGKGLEELLKKMNEEFKFKIVGPHKQQIYGRSDQASFYRKNVPGMFFFSDFHSDYHKQGDLPEKINVAGMAKVASLSEKIVGHLTQQEKGPEYVPGVIQAKGFTKAKAGKLGITPDSSDKGDKGVLVESVTAGGPAAKGGVMAGDRITAIDTTPTPNVATYLTVLQQVRAGTAVELTIQRSGKEMKLKVTPE